MNDNVFFFITEVVKWLKALINGIWEACMFPILVFITIFLFVNTLADMLFNKSAERTAEHLEQNTFTKKLTTNTRMISVIWKNLHLF